ncbi:hypothetical protein E1B28_004891 [Marasmius oreades]|uniref:Uncharacterized protein n=1 Tax=Marasmius oreades TaxID=181124 RepID=A0A9P7UZK7_9AGAR|nr:uncharacterized protein E1B28_004891 [Marasmius oreades]KAG7097553.1 hypothetical protein E1B28_004891 [Marasmius oreades]
MSKRASSRGPGTRLFYQSWNRGLTSSSNQNSPLFTVDSIKNDLTPQLEKPLWPLSSYAAAKYETNLISGLDESFEELRCKAVTAMGAGNVSQYIQYETDRISQAEKSISDARNNVQQAYDQAVKQSNVTSMLNNSISGSDSSSNALKNTTASGSSNTTAFGNATTSAFGQPSFGQSAFGQPSTSSSVQTAQPTSAFGQAASAPSAFQQAAPQSNSVFGQPSQPSSVFGQSSQPSSSLIKPATSGAFGAYANSAPTAFGAGAPPTPNTTSGGFASFTNPSGQATAFGAAAAAPSTTTSAFGTGGSTGFATSSSGPVTSAFGSQASNNVFGSSMSGAPPSAFGSSATPASTSAFGSPSVFGSTAMPTNAAPVSSVFGAPAPVSAFGVAGQAAAPSAFDSSSAFGSNTSMSFGSSGGGFGAPPAAPKKSLSSVPDFKSAMSQSYVQGKCPYDSQLPANYLSEVVPKNVIELFKAEKFEWGKVPDWIPPLELR